MATSRRRHAPSPGTPAAPSAAATAAPACAVCLETVTLAEMPCCHAAAPLSTTRFCLPCMVLVCGGERCPGRCPKCRASVVVEDGAVLINDRRARCRMCLQQRVLVRQGMCDPCNIGAAHPREYECERCKRMQFIPHPMYRSQPALQLYSTDTWACQSCGKFTHWRLRHPHQLPLEDVPPTWGEFGLQEVIVWARQRRGVATANRFPPLLILPVELWFWDYDGYKRDVPRQLHEPILYATSGILLYGAWVFLRLAVAHVSAVCFFSTPVVILAVGSPARPEWGYPAWAWVGAASWVVAASWRFPVVVLSIAGVLAARSHCVRNRRRP